MTHDDEAIARGAFYTFIGQLKDGLELAWQTDEVSNEQDSRE